MTNPALSALDDAIHAAFAAVGMADSAVLRRRTGGADVPCRIFVDREPSLGEMGGVDLIANMTRVRMLRAEVGQAPRKGDVVVAGAESFTVDRVERTDESMWWLVCNP